MDKKNYSSISGKSVETSISGKLPQLAGVKIWSSDFHISPVADIKSLLSPYNVKVVDKSLSSHCQLTNTCQTNLRIINKDNGITLGRCPNRLRRKFYDHYRTNNELLSVDAVLCTYAFASCVELFMPFNRSLVVIFTTRFETGRHDAKAWKRWIETLRRVAANPYNVIAANNLYDVEYVKYFTGIQHVELLPSLCQYVTARYAPTRPQVLIGPGRGLHEDILRSLYQSVRNVSSTPSVVPLRELYAHYEYSDLAAHPAMILVPYQVSIMTIFELYHMQVPLFVPSPGLLVDWHIEYGILTERTWSGVMQRPNDKSVLPRHPDSSSILTDVDPNNDLDKDAILAWLQFADFYQWPHISVFNSWEHLWELFRTSNLRAISTAMGDFNAMQEEKTKRKWEKISAKIVNGRLLRKRVRRWLPPDLNDALELNSYGIRLSTSNCRKARFNTTQ